MLKVYQFQRELSYVLSLKFTSFRAQPYEVKENWVCDSKMCTISFSKIIEGFPFIVEIFLQQYLQEGKYIPLKNSMIAARTEAQIRKDQWVYDRVINNMA